MSKYLEIDACAYCRYCHDYSGTCLHRLGRDDVRIPCDDIPSWCPLPNAPEGAHCADTTKEKT